MKPILNKWQFWFRPFGRDHYRVESDGWHLFDAGIIKIKRMPEQGEALSKYALLPPFAKDYQGFIVRFMWWFPIDRV